MNEYLVIQFDRYETSNTREERVVAESPLQAYEKVCPLDEVHEKEDRQDREETHEQVSDTFSCLAYEESDVLIYLLKEDVDKPYKGPVHIAVEFGRANMLYAESDEIEVRDQDGESFYFISAEEVKPEDSAAFCGEED